MDAAVEQTTFHVGQEVRAKKNLYDDLREHGMGSPLYARLGEELVIREISNSGQTCLVSHPGVENSSFRVMVGEIEPMSPTT